jgi:NAD(P)-dependent dehydrogenase (short-subunit alcohol dehydrogenase family)
MRTAIVTGANRGIGREVARQLAMQGYRVVLTSRDPEKGARALEEIRKVAGPNRSQDCLFHPLDVTDGRSIHALREFVESSFGGLDILVNNAAVLLDVNGDIQNIPVGVIRDTMETNAYGPLALCQAFLPSMIRRSYGRIVNVSSESGQRENMINEKPAYRLSKLALNGITLILADSVKGKNILVNAVHPGWVQTDMGSPEAPLTVEKGAETIVWLATLPDDGPRGGLFYDRKAMRW